MRGDLQFSVITVCLNSANIIHRTCESIQQQNYKNFEWIVIDGQSSDATLDILNSYCDAIDILISEKDSGIYNAMNKGISQAKGEYLLFMNAGDCFFDSNTLSTVSENLGADILYGDALFNGSSIQVKEYPKVLPKDFFIKNTLCHQSSYFRRALFKEYKSYDESFRIAGDYELFTRFLKYHGVSSHHVGHVLCNYYLGGVSNDKNFKRLRNAENHRIRWRYFTKYRSSFKALRQLCKQFFHKIF